MARPLDRQRRPRIRPRKVDRRRRPALERLEEMLLLSYTVTNTNDSGPGSLRFEINTANQAGVAATIDFNISGSGPITIAVGSTSGVQLPTIKVPLTIDGWSEGTFQGSTTPDAQPWIVLDGSALAGANGLDVANGPGSVIQGLSIVNFHFDTTNLSGGNGIIVEGPSTGVTIQGDDVGVGVDGTTLGGNDLTGISLFSTDATVGGTTAAAADVISGNGNGPQGQGAGVFVASTPFLGPTATGNVIEGDKIGTDATGTTAIANDYGVVLAGAVATTVGGTTADVISGNSNAGVYLTSNGFGFVPSEATSGNVVAGDLIGTDAIGAAALGNGLDGVLIDGGATGNTVGDGGVIAGNGFYGVQVTGAGTDRNLIQDALIGTNAAGNGAVANAFSGVLFDSGASANRADSDTISGNGGDGVSIVGAGNNSVTGSVIGLDASGSVALGNGDSGVSIYTDGNGVGATDNRIAGDTIGANGAGAFSGVGISGAGTTGNVVTGDLVGTDAAGDAGLGNGNGGVSIFGGAAGNSVLGSTLSGNTNGGVQISGGGTTGNVVAGSLIGLDPTGTTALPNSGDGVDLFAGATGNTIGGTADGAGNVISGNDFSGVTPSGAGTSGNLIAGNTIGTDPTGTVAIPNAFDGIGVFGGTGSNTISGNLVSGNTLDGISIADAGSDGYMIVGNMVGTDATGTRALPNREGILIYNGASDETITGNLVSGNDAVGIYLDTGAGDLVTGNTVGTDTTGTKPLGNAFQGIFVGSARDVTVGGATAADRNLVSGNGNNGIVVVGAGATGDVVQGNDAGTDVHGTTAIPNAFDGLYVGSGAAFNPPFDGSATGVTVLGNLFSGNTEYGIHIIGVGASGIVVAGNRIGTDATGTKALGNGLDGVFLSAGASGNTVGGATSAVANVIAGNLGDGVRLRDAGTSGNVVAGNFIGTDTTGTKNLGNQGDGVAAINLASNNTIGGTVAGAGNTIAFNQGNGVTVGSSKTDTVVGDAVLTNDIFSNSKIGIDLADDGVTLNNSEGHAGPNLFQDFPVLGAVQSGATGTTVAGTIGGAPNTTFRVEFFLNSVADPTGYGQGQAYVGYAMITTNASGVGTIAYHIATALPVGQFLSATATDPSGNTSEFAKDIPITPAPTPSYRLSLGGYRYNRANGQFLQYVTITNTGAEPILGPISLVLDNLSSGVTLLNANGTTTTGSPYINFNLGAGDELLPNQSVTLLLDFGDPKRAAIRYTSRLIFGPGPR